MRVYREPDAFPSNDRRLRRAASTNGGALAAPELEALAERWRPWRAYAAMCLWESDRCNGAPSPTYFQGNRDTSDRITLPEQVA
jgi:AraC family transcriptional regulator of adaptative response / DNA-3-methyladenine glycosylase II